MVTSALRPGLEDWTVANDELLETLEQALSESPIGPGRRAGQERRNGRPSNYSGPERRAPADRRTIADRRTGAERRRSSIGEHRRATRRDQLAL